MIEQDAGPVSVFPEGEPAPRISSDTKLASARNTRYGRSGPAAATGSPSISAEQAQQLADRWLGENAPGRVASTADAYPGYYTLETASRGQIDGMLSVNAITGAVWAHTWHGRFLAKEDR